MRRLLGLLVCTMLIWSCDDRGPTGPDDNDSTLLPSGAYRFEVFVADENTRCVGWPVSFTAAVTRDASSWSARPANPDLGSFELLLEIARRTESAIEVTGAATGVAVATTPGGGTAHVTFASEPESRSLFSGAITRLQRQDVPVASGDASGPFSLTSTIGPEPCSFSRLRWRIARP